jgi:hypothetical protein
VCLQVDCDQFRRFWIRWEQEKGTIQVGSGAYNTHPLLSWDDPEPLTGIRYAAVSSWNNVNGEWEFARTEGILVWFTSLLGECLEFI